MADHSPPTGFLDVVLVWLRRDIDPVATQVLRIESFGTDTAGSTEDGFHPDFELGVYYTRSDGAARFYKVEGDDMDRLWRTVVAGWPERSAGGLMGEEPEVTVEWRWAMRPWYAWFRTSTGRRVGVTNWTPSRARLRAEELLDRYLERTLLAELVDRERERRQRELVERMLAILPPGDALRREWRR